MDIKKKNKNQVINIMILVAVTGIVLYFSLKDNYQMILHEIFTLNIWWLLCGIFLVLGCYYLRSISLYHLIRKFHKQYSMKKAFKLTLTTQFLNGVTPFSTGGQPFQIYILKKDGIRLGDGANIIMQNFIVYQIALVLLGIIAITYNFIFHVFQESGLLRDLTTIGFLINTLVTVGLFVIAFAKKFNQFIIKKLVSLLYKLHIVKNKETTMDKMSDSIENFHDGAKLLMSDQKSFVYNIFLNFLSLICLYLVPLTIAYSVGVFDSFTGIESIVSSAYVMLIGAFVPIPGGTGGLEYSYMAFYGNFLKGSILNASMIMWRFLTYYLGMIIGAITLNLKERKK